MKQLKLDEYLVPVRNAEAQEDIVYRQECKRSIPYAFGEYEDITQNVYRYRQREEATHDVMYCQCQARANWRLSCGDECYNRASQTECVLGGCFTKYKYGNQRMQQGYQVEPSLGFVGEKGIGLIADEAINPGDLVGKYVGEVLTRTMYLEREHKERLRFKHRYGMAVTFTEVIDARHHGGMMRFANHSCDPNCTVERWEIGGEICLGVFAQEKISQGDEITFDYGNEFVAGEVSRSLKLTKVTEVFNAIRTMSV